MNIFEQAMRLKLRFNHKGLWATEDLWDLSLLELDKIFKQLNSQVKQQSEESLLEVKDKEESILDLKIEIIKHIVKTKIAEKQEREDSQAKSAEKQRILEIIDRKKNQKLEDMSLEELEKLI